MFMAVMMLKRMMTVEAGRNEKIDGVSKQEFMIQPGSALVCLIQLKPDQLTAVMVVKREKRKKRWRAFHVSLLLRVS